MLSYFNQTDFYLFNVCTLGLFFHVLIVFPLTITVVIKLLTLTKTVISFLVWFWGDPHIKTLDDKGYTFNGIGEYVMVDADNGTFILQARTVLAPGNRSIATIFSAGAAKEYNTSKVEVRVTDECKRNTASVLFYKQCSSFF